MNYILSALSLIGFYSFSEKIGYLNFNKKNNIIINFFVFSFIIFIIYIVNSYFFLFNLSSKFFSLVLFFGSLVFGILFLILNYDKIYFFIKKNFLNKSIAISLISFFILSHLIPSDEDSIRYHLEIPQKIIDGSFYNNHWFDYIVVGSNEFINLFGLHLGFTNTSGVLNFTYLFFIILSNNFFFKKKKIGSEAIGNFVILSCPYVIALIASQKMYLLPCYIAAYSIAYLYIYKNQIFYKEIILIISLNIFAVVTKPIFLPYLGVVVFYSLYILKFDLKNKIYLLFFTFAITIISYLPLGVIKYKIYGDPFLPILSINKLNFDWWNLYSKEVLTSSQMDFTDQLSDLYKVLLIPIKLIIPLQIEDLFKTLGLGFFFIFFLEYKKNKNLFFLILIFFFSTLILNNYQSRWFFPLFLLICIFLSKTKFKILNNLPKYQFLVSLIVIIPFSLLTLISGALDSKLFSQKNIIDAMNIKYNNQKYFSNLNSYFYQKNEIPVYITQKNILIKYDPDFFKKKNEIKLFLYDEKDGHFNEFVKKNFLCGSYKIIEKFDYNTRRFFIFGKKQNVKLYKLLC
ncbi:hypothetical protein MCEGEM12_00213 [Candidatus Pelagibacterales bacterium]